MAFLENICLPVRILEKVNNSLEFNNLDKAIYFIEDGFTDSTKSSCFANMNCQ